jgi:hypothetical protein
MKPYDGTVTQARNQSKNYLELLGRWPAFCHLSRRLFGENKSSFGGSKSSSAGYIHNI